MPQYRLIAVVLLCIANLSHVLSAPFVHRQDSVRASKIDSLIILSDQLSDTQRLRIYQELHYMLYELNDPNTHLSHIQHFIENSMTEKHELSKAFAYMLKVDALHNYRVSDSIMRVESEKALAYMRTIKDDPEVEQYYFDVGMRLVSNYILSKNYEKALDMAEEFYNEAKEKGNHLGIASTLNGIARAYHGLWMYDKAIESYREVIEMVDGELNISVTFEAYKYLIDLYIKTRRINEALTTCNEYETFIKRSEHNPRIPRRVVGKLWFYYCLLSANIQRELGQYAIAEKYIAQAETYPSSTMPLGIYVLEDSRFNLLLKQKKYVEAEKSIDRIDEVYKKKSTYYDKLRLLYYQALLYHRWKKYDKAVEAYREYLVRNDSIKRVEMGASLNFLRTKYEVDKIEMRREQQKRIFQNTILWLSIVLVLFCVIIGVVIANAQKLRAKNCLLLNRIRKLDELEQKNEQMRNELVRSNLSASAENERGDNLRDIYLNLQQLMKDPAVFTDPNINRKVIAEKLGTNEKYVFDMIHEYYGMTISDYINNLRVNYAKNLLSLLSEKRTIETIALEAGFNSRSIFYRLFKEQYGMTPVEFRRLAVGL